MNVKLQTIHLTEGKFYMVTSEGSKLIHKCKFIRSTPKGYNFFSYERNKNLFKTHIYPVKNSDNKQFWMLACMKITECSSTELSCENYLQYKKRMVSDNQDYSWADYQNNIFNVKH